MSILFFFFRQKTAYELRISDWSSDVCSSDLGQIYSLLPLTTRPPVLGARFGKRSNGETRLACQCQSWERRPHEAIFPSPPPAGPKFTRPGHPFLGPPRRSRRARQSRTHRQDRKSVV